MSNESIPPAESTELEAGAAIATTEQQPQDQKETQAETLAEAPKDPFATGRQRMNTISQSVSSAKEKATSKIKNLGSKFSSFFSRTKKVVGEGAMTSVAAVLSAPEIAQKVDDKMGQLAEQSGEFLGQKITQGTEWVQDKAEIASFMATAAIEASRESLVSARDAVKGKLEQASQSVKKELAEKKKAYNDAKTSFWNKVNSYRMAKLQEKIEKLDAKKQQAMAEISLLSRLNDVQTIEVPMENSFIDDMELAA